MSEKAFISLEEADTLRIDRDAENSMSEEERRKEFNKLLDEVKRAREPSVPVSSLLKVIDECEAGVFSSIVAAQMLRKLIEEAGG